MIRRGIAGLILGVALLAGSLAWSGFLALRTVFDADRSRDVAQELLDNDAVKAQLVENMGDAISGLIPAEAAISPELVEAAATRTLEDPAVEALILSAFADTHAAFLGDGDAPDALDLTPVAEAARRAVVSAAPQLDEVVPATPLLEVPLPTERIPDASPVREFLERAVPVLALAALIGIGVALFTTNDRPSVLRRAGVWALGTTAFYLAIGLGLPWVIRQIAPDQAEVIAALLTALLRTTLVPSIVLGICGVGLITASMLWPDPGRQKVVAPRGGEPDPAPRPAARRATRQPVAAPQAPAPAARSAPPPNRFPYPGPPGHPQQPNPVPAAAGPPTLTQQAVPAAGHPPTPTAPPPRPERAMPPAPSPERAMPQPAPQPTNSVFEPSPVPPPRRATATPDAFSPRWVEGFGWVLHPDDPRPVPDNATWVAGVGHVVPGPPP